MERPLAVAALALDFIQQLPSEQSETSAPLSGVLTEQINLFELEIEKLGGQITSHASGDFVVLFREPVSAVICAVSLHRMFAALSQGFPELEPFQLRIGIHAEASTGDDTQAQQKCIEIAHELKERSGGSIFISRAVASTIDETALAQVRQAGEHKLTAAAEPLGIFELMPPLMKPLQIKQKSRFSQLRLPLAAAVGLFIIGGTSYGYLHQTGVIEWPPAPWFETAFEQKAEAPPAKPIKPLPSEDRTAERIAATDESAVAAILHPPEPGALQSSPAVKAETAKEQPPAVTEVPVQPTAIMPVQKGSPAAPQQPEGQQQPQQRQRPKEGSSRIAAASPPEKPVARQVLPTQSLSPVASQQRILHAPTETPTPTTGPSAATTTLIPQEQQEQKSQSSPTVSISTVKPRARPAQLSSSPAQPPIQQTEQGASSSPAGSDQTALSVMSEPPAARAEPATIPPKQPTELQKIQGESSRVAPVPTPAKKPTPETQRVARAVTVPSTTPERVARAEQTAAVEAPTSEAGSLDQQSATQNATEPQVSIGAEPKAPEMETVQAKISPQGCEFLRQAFHRGTLVPNVDKAAYKRFIECRRLKTDRKRQGDLRVAAKPANQRGNQQSSDGGATGGDSSSSGGPGNSGGKSNGKGKGKGN